MRPEAGCAVGLEESSHDGWLSSLRRVFRPDVLTVFAPFPSPLLLGLACGGWMLLGGGALAQSYVALMEGQKAVPLRGQFNSVPVLHSNQPEEVEGPGLLISTVPTAHRTHPGDHSGQSRGETRSGELFRRGGAQQF